MRSIHPIQISDPTCRSGMMSGCNFRSSTCVRSARLPWGDRGAWGPSAEVAISRALDGILRWQLSLGFLLTVKEPKATTTTRVGQSQRAGMHLPWLLALWIYGEGVLFELGDGSLIYQPWCPRRSYRKEADEPAAVWSGNPGLNPRYTDYSYTTSTAALRNSTDDEDNLAGFCSSEAFGSSRQETT